jgi:hypothetical protein
VIISNINDKLAGENLTYVNLKYKLDDVIDDINAALSSKFPAFSEFTAEKYPQYPDYNFFPDSYIRSVVCTGGASKFYQTDEEGAVSAPAYDKTYRTNLFIMTRDYSEQIPEEYRDYERGALINPNNPDASTFVWGAW